MKKFLICITLMSCAVLFTTSATELGSATKKRTVTFGHPIAKHEFQFLQAPFRPAKNAPVDVEGEGVSLEARFQLRAQEELPSPAITNYILAMATDSFTNKKSLYLVDEKYQARGLAAENAKLYISPTTGELTKKVPYGLDTEAKITYFRSLETFRKLNKALELISKRLLRKAKGSDRITIFNPHTERNYLCSVYKDIDNESHNYPLMAEPFIPAPMSSGRTGPESSPSLLIHFLLTEWIPLDLPVESLFPHEEKRCVIS